MTTPASTTLAPTSPSPATLVRTILAPKFVALSTISALSLLVCPTVGQAQEPTTEPARIVGSVTDSLGGAVLRGATVHLLPTERTAVTDSVGSFSFEDLPPGRYRLTLTHDDVPSWVMEGREASVSVGSGDVVRLELATPSARALARQHCPGGRVAAATVRDLLTLAPVPMAEITVRPGGGGDPSVGRSDALGEHHVCVGPDDDSVTFQPRIRTTEGRSVSSPLDGPFVHRTLFLRTTPPSRIEGVVREEGTGASIADVTVSLEGARARSVSDADGRFVLPGVPPGEITLTTQHIGYGEARGQVLVGLGDTLSVEILLSPAAVELERLTVEVQSSTAADRMEVASRVDALSRAEIDALLPRVTDVAGLLRNAHFPGLQVKEVRYLDETTGIMVPGVCIEIGRRQARYARTCEGMVSVYVNGVRHPGSADLLQSLPPGAIESIRVLSPLEAGLQYGDGLGARNGVLLITTR